MSCTTKRAVAYIRMSTDDQRDSPQQQRHEIQQLAAQHGLKVSKWYEDHGITGNSLQDRPEFCRLLEDAENRKFDTILCWDQDRFSRADMIDIGRIIAPLRDAGVTLITKAQGIINWSDFSGQIAYLVTQNAKNQFLFDLSRNSLRGRVNKSRKGFWQGNPTFGYDRVYYDEHGRIARRVPWGERFRAPLHWNCKLAPTEDSGAIETVRFIFQQFVNTGMSVGAIRTLLNNRGIKSPSGGDWCRASIIRILTNVAYAGHTMFGKKRCGKYHRLSDSGDVIRGQPTQEQRSGAIVVKNTHDPLVDERTFQRCQEKYQTVPRKFARHVSPYSLSRVLVCGHCGGRLHGNSTPFGRRYMCTNATQKRTCRTYRIHSESLERFLAYWVSRVLAGSTNLARLQSEIRSRADARGDSESVNTTSLKRHLSRIESNISQGQENILVADRKYVAELQATLEGWHKQRLELRREIERLEKRKGSEPERLSGSAIDRLGTYFDAFNAEDVLRLKSAFATTLESVTVYMRPRQAGKRTRYSFERGDIRVIGARHAHPFTAEMMAAAATNTR